MRRISVQRTLLATAGLWQAKSIDPAAPPGQPALTAAAWFLAATSLASVGQAGVAEPPPPSATIIAERVPLSPAQIEAWSEEMKAGHPALKSAGARLRAAEAATNSVRFWQDPMFRFGGTISAPRGFKEREEGNLLYGLEQKLPVFGKEQSSREVARAEAGVEGARLGNQWLVLRRDLVRALMTLGLAERVREIGEQDVAWLQTMAEVTREKYRAGRATQVELLRVENERSRQAERLRTDGRWRDQARVSVNRLLARDPAGPFPPVALPPLAEAVGAEGGAALEELALQGEPKLRVLQSEIQQAQATMEATRRSRRPDLTLGIEGRQFTGDGGFREGTFVVGLSLPWLNAGKYRSDLSRDRARAEAARFDSQDYSLGVREGVRRLLVQIDAARREALLYDQEILPRSRQALESAHAAWVSGVGVFNDTMEARRMVIDGQLMLARAIAEQHQMLAELLLLCGLTDSQQLAHLVPPRSIPDTSHSPQP